MGEGKLCEASNIAHTVARILSNMETLGSSFLSELFLPCRQVNIGSRKTRQGAAARMQVGDVLDQGDSSRDGEQ